MKKVIPLGYYGRSPYSVKWQVGYPVKGKISLSEQKSFNKENGLINVVYKNNSFLVKETPGKVKDFKKTKDYIFFEITDRQFASIKEHSLKGVLAVATQKQLDNRYTLKK